MTGWLSSLPASPEAAAEFVWWSSLALGLVVSLVVTLLLWMIHREAGKINERVSKICDVGQRVANNTIHIPALYTTNRVVGEILGTAVKIAEGAAVIETHANGCPGCPQCMLRH